MTKPGESQLPRPFALVLLSTPRETVSRVIPQNSASVPSAIRATSAAPPTTFS